MCARFTLTMDYASLAEKLGVEKDHSVGEIYRARFNVAPSEDQWVMRRKDQRRELLLARWGLTNHWARSLADGTRQINARCETAATRPAFRDAFRRHRCIVPADGFYEWTGPRNRRQPIWFHRPDGELLLMAGLYETFADEQRGPVKTFSILTTESVGEVADVHDRMPLILPPDLVETWVTISDDDDPHALRDLLMSIHEEGLVGREVSRRVNKAGVDDPHLLDPPATDSGSSQGSLF